MAQLWVAGKTWSKGGRGIKFDNIKKRGKLAI